MGSNMEALILNVDDNEAGRYAVTRTLQLHRFAVLEASTGTEALRIAAENLPDLVLLDVNLPDINGFEVCRRLKSQAVTARIPVVHLTASYQNPGDMARGLDSGADSYLMEPVEPEVLIAAVHAILRARRAEETARALAREWQAIFDAISDGVALVSPEGRVLRCNQSLGRLLDRPAAAIAGEPHDALWGPVMAEKLPLLGARENRRRESVELQFDERRLTFTADPISDDAGRSAGTVLIVSDVTEKRQLEEQFRESQKFETIGTLAAGVAHDFNNLLTSVMGNASLVLGDLPGDSPHRERLDDVVRAAERAADLTRQLLAYSGKGRHFTQKVDLSGLVAGMQALIEASVPKTINLALQLAPRLPRIEADSNQIQQLLLNLVSNAAEAIGDGAGALEILTGRDGDMVFLQVRDTGCGMDEETRSRIFDPFFSTKFTGRGLGLAAAAGIARGHKASIQVATSPGAGSTFRVTFPRAEEPEIPAVRNASAKGGTVLVVDDEEMVRRIAQASLELRGFRVLIASNGAEAIEQVRNRPEIGLVLLDLTMPVMGGEEAIDHIRAVRPGIKVIVSTGYDHREAVARFGRKGVAGYLQKPYTSRQLGERVQALIGGAAAGTNS
jgi:CheY-like chemotaxis protein/nitrogen-specific signal transduction histidine kinase